MRAVLCKEFGGPEKLAIEEVPAPAMREGHVRIKIHAAGVNFGDTLLITGQYQEKPPFPFIPGMEVAGVVTEVAPGVKHLKPGDRVLASIGRGGYAEEAVAEADIVHRIPDAMDFVTAAGFPVAYSTSHGAFEWRARLKPGEWVLVLGAS
ncbi:MAG TPA: alcohol dehydrogenase catalytic domain-containing protein, partial [Stellaceae bacterium]